MTMKQGSFNSLSDILNEHNQLIIPDLQRDYCWGHIKPKDQEKTLAYNFCYELLEAAKNVTNKDNLEISYGIIYTYEYPETFYYLCDGQQRLTTLYLTIGVLNSFLEDKRLKELLVLENQQPRLKYEVRTTTDYFISDLVKHTFLSVGKFENIDIRKSNWFRKDFEDDPSIKSMIDALKSISLIVNKYNAQLLADFILDSIGFVSVNLKGNESLEDNTYSKVREYGEKMYEIVNTSGDPMEPNEHIKVILLSELPDNEKQKWTERWEMWQDFFWNKKSNEHETADEGFNEFLSWIEAIKGKDGKIDSVEEIDEYFKALFLWCEIQSDLTRCRKAKVLNIIENLHIKKPSKLVVILPVLVYLRNTVLVKFTDNGYVVNKDHLEIESIFRFIRFFTNISKNSEASIIALSLANELKPNEDILNVLNSKKQFKSILSDEEMFKLKVLKQAGGIVRKEIEDVFWEAEDHDYLNGKIMPVFNWMEIECNNSNVKTFPIESFRSIYKSFVSLFNDSKIDTVKLLLLALTSDWDVYREGWSWGRPRYFLGLKELKFWREKVTYEIFKVIVLNENKGTLTDKLLGESIMNLEHTWQRKVVRKLKSEASKHWQWTWHNRFFVYENELYLPNGVQAKANTEKIEL